MTTMTLGTVSVCMTVLVLNVHHRSPRSRRVPNWIRQLVLVYLARLVRYQTDQTIASPSSEPRRRRRTCRPPSQCRQPLTSPFKCSSTTGDSTSRPRCSDTEVWKRHCRYTCLDQDGDVERQPACNASLRCDKQSPAQTVSPLSPPSSSPRAASLTSSRRRPGAGGLRSIALDCRLRRKLIRSTSSSKSKSYCSAESDNRRELVGLRLSHFTGDTATVSGTDLDNERNSWAAAAAAVNSTRFRPSRCIDSDPDECIDFNEEEDECDAVSTGNDVIEQLDEEQPSKRVEEWHEVARVLDRTFFWVLFALMALSGGIILLYPKYSGYDDSWSSP